MTHPPHGGQDPSPDGPDQTSARPAGSAPEPRSSAPVSPSPAFGPGEFPPEAHAYPPEMDAYPPSGGGQPDVRHFRADEPQPAPASPAVPGQPGDPGGFTVGDPSGTAAFGAGDPYRTAEFGRAGSGDFGGPPPFGAPPGPPDLPPGGPPGYPPGGGPDGPEPDPSEGPFHRRRGPLIGAVVAVTLILFIGGGIAAWTLLRNSENGEGAAEPAVAVTAFLEAVYRDKDPGRAGALVCAEARDDAALTRKIDEIKAYDQRFDQPTFEWGEPAVDEQTEDRAVVTVDLEMVTADEKTAEQPLRFTVVRKAGWWICDVG